MEGYLGYFNRDAIIKCAEEIREKAPVLLESRDWDAIRELITIGNEYWFGPSADKYQLMVDSICKNQDAESKSTVMMLPDALEAFMLAAQKKYSHS